MPSIPYNSDKDIIEKARKEFAEEIKERLNVMTLTPMGSRYYEFVVDIIDRITLPLDPDAPDPEA